MSHGRVMVRARVWAIRINAGDRLGMDDLSREWTMGQPEPQILRTVVEGVSMARSDLDQGREPTQSARSAVMEQAMAIAGEIPSPVLRSLVCPYCGTITPDTGRCSACNGRFNPLSRQATQNQMGPWSIRDDRLPFRPGCTYETIARLIDQGKISTETILRGPSTRQFWTLARHAPGIANLLGMCHSCQMEVKPDAFACPSCHAPFTTERDRQHLGLGPSRPLPGQGLPEVLALRAEPASQPGFEGSQGGGVVSAPIGVQGEMAGGLQAGVSGGGVGGEHVDMAGARRQVEEAARLARRWKSAWETQRRNAWTVIVISILITLSAMTYAVLGGKSTDQGGGLDGESAPMGQVPALLDE